MQGFKFPDGRLYYADITEDQHIFSGYRLMGSTSAAPIYYPVPKLVLAGLQNVYYLNYAEVNGQCGYQVVEGQYEFKDTGKGAIIGIINPPGAVKVTYYRACEVPDYVGSWTTDAQGIKHKTVVIQGSTFYLTEQNGDITVKGQWKTFSKCATCGKEAQKALDNALTKARAKNGKITESTLIVEGITKPYGSAGEIIYQDMNLMDMLKNLATTYNSLLDKAKVPEEVWLPGKEFFVRDGTGVVSGALDQGLEEAKEIPELVGLGLSLVSDPEGVYNQLSTFAQQMDWEKVKKLGADIAKDAVQYENFEKGGQYAKYGTGRVGVMVAKTVVTGGLTLVAIVKDAPNQLKKSLDDIAALLDNTGRFVDAILEADYQKYLSRKASDGKVPRERLDWKQERDYWLKDSPMARGNAFNKKAIDNDWYDFNEVTLANGKRVDGYTPPTNGKPGEIVSRKATNLEEIELATFESYLKEMKVKYSAGEPINAPKYGDDLKGKVLEGKQILEIPESNQNFIRIQEYIDLAKSSKYNIEIRFRPE